MTPPDDEPLRLAHDQQVELDFVRSLRRSRARRAVAARLRTRRRRTRGGGGTVAVALVAGALLSPLAFAGTADSPAPLRAGSTGSAVSEVQEALGVPATGRYDAATRRAVRAFQRRNGLVVDGIVGPATRRALLGGSGGSATPAPKTTSVPAGTGGSAADWTGTVDPADLETLRRIAACESGGDPTAISSGGRYRGKYQFTRATWASIGGAGDPAAASEGEQDLRALQLLQREGTDPWPACAKDAS